MHNWNSWDWTYGGGFIMGLGMLLVWLVPLVLIIVVVMYLNNQSRTTRQFETAIDLLEKAYARGEIGRDEFQKKRADILDTKELSKK